MSINRHSDYGILKMQILWFLLKNPEHGYGLMRKLSKVKGKKITQGTIYPTLSKLERNGLIKAKNVGNKKVYSLTKKGRKVANEVCTEFTRTFFGIFHDFVCVRCKHAKR